MLSTFDREESMSNGSLSESVISCFSPWKKVTESHPSVCLVQLIKRRAEQTEVKLLVFWSVKLHLAMDLTI